MAAATDQVAGAGTMLPVTDHSGDATGMVGPATKPATVVGAVVSAAALVTSSAGRYVLAGIAGMAVVAVGLGALAIRDWHGAIADAATATCRFADLQASEVARGALQSQLNRLGDDMTAMARDVSAAEARRAAAVAALESVKGEKACRVDLRPLKAIGVGRLAAPSR